MPRSSEVNTSGRRWRYTKRKPTSHTKRRTSSRMDPGYPSMTDPAIPLIQSLRDAPPVALSHHHVFPDRAVAPASNAPRIQITAGAVAGTSGSGIHAAVERSKYVRQAMALYEAQTYEPQKAAHLQPHGSRIFLHDELC